MGFEDGTELPEAQAYLQAQVALLNAWQDWKDHKITSAQLEAARAACDLADMALKTANEARDRKNKEEE